MKRVKVLVVAQAIVVLALIFSSWKPVAELIPVDTKLYWDEKNELDWSHFQPVRKHGSDAAMSSIAMESHSVTNKSGVFIRIRASFNPVKSWVKNDCQTAYILNHEQMHYNIVELYARKLRKAVAEKKFSRTNFSAEYNRLFDKYAYEHEIYQDRYDEETEHSILRSEQAEWNAKVLDEMKSLEDYASPMVKINFR